MANRFYHSVHEKHIPLNDLETLNASSPDRRVSDPNVLCPLNRPVGHGPVAEVRRWTRFGVEGTTSALDLCCMQRNPRAAVPPREVAERVTEER